MNTEKQPEAQLEAEGAATPSDAEIEDFVRARGVTWVCNEHTYAWLTEDADLHPLIRAVLARWGAPKAVSEPVQKRHPACVPDTLVNGGALTLAINTLRRAGKQEIADELEITASRQSAPVPLTDDQIAKGFTRRSRHCGLFVSGVRFAEAAHGITSKPEGAQQSEPEHLTDEPTYAEEADSFLNYNLSELLAFTRSIEAAAHDINSKPEGAQQ